MQLNKHDRDERETRIAAFLEAAGWDGAERTPLAGDASFRRYERLSGDEGRAVLMDAPPPEDVRPFRRVAEMLTRMGFSAPKILARDETGGLLLLEDFGDCTFARALRDGAAAHELYGLAVDALVALNDIWDPQHGVAAGLPAYDDALLVGREAALFLDWYLPAVGVKVDAAGRAAYAAAWRKALAAAHSLPTTLVLRDYFPENLMLLEDRSGVACCGLLDFQDAVVGSCAYDLASLLQDARRPVAPEVEETMIARFLEAYPALDEQAFRAGYTVLAAQRHAKVIGIFTRLAQRDGKPDYLKHIPHVWSLMERALPHPALEPVKMWFDRWAPAELRRRPKEETST